MTAPRDASGESRLVAYWVPRPGPAPSIAELRVHLDRRLPAYMVPVLYVRMGSLPLTPIGKVDYTALPEPDESASEREEYVAARTPTERTLSAIWSEVLGLARIGVHDDFFKMGGHSLLALNVMARIRPLFGVALPAAVLFHGRTIEQLARIVDGCPRCDGPRLYRSCRGGKVRPSSASAAWACMSSTCTSLPRL